MRHAVSVLGLVCVGCAPPASEVPDWRAIVDHSGLEPVGGWQGAPLLGYDLPGDQIDLSVDGSGLTLTDDASAVHLALERFSIDGYEPALLPLVPDVAIDCDACIFARRRGLTSWWVADEAGIEHGWVVPDPGANPGQLRFDLAISGATPVVRHDGRGAYLRRSGATDLRYVGLRAWDADGADLPARLDADGETLSVVVDVDGAAWPVTVDPYATVAATKLPAPFFPYRARGHRRMFKTGDVNGDGYGDYLRVGQYYTNSYDQVFDVHLGSSRGLSLGFVQRYSVTTPPSSFTPVAGVGDVNGDGYDDLVSLSGTGTARVYLGSSTGPPSTPSQTISGLPLDYQHVVGWGDVNGDGYHDVMLGFRGLHLGSASGLSATAQRSFPARTVRRVDLSSDVDGDGYDDLIAGNPDWCPSTGCGSMYSPDGRLEFIRGGSSGLETGFTQAINGGAGEQFTYQMQAAGDVDGDGYGDLLVDGNPSTVRMPGSSAGFGKTPAWSLSAYAGTPIVIGDSDDDGSRDLALIVPYKSQIAVRETGSTGDWPATATQTLTPGTTPVYHVADAGDIDGDGCDDLYVNVRFRAWIYHSTSCGPSVDADGDGYDTDSDCDDSDSAVYPGATDTPGDGVDQDCDGLETCFIDADGDGYRVTGATLTSDDVSCTSEGMVPAGLPDGDCVDWDPAINPGAAEIVGDGVDQNCDGDELCFADRDLDGWRSEDTVVSSDLMCTGGGEAPAGAGPIDCDDGDRDVRPGGTELPSDGVDSDCDGMELCFADADFDGFGTDATVLESSDVACGGIGMAHPSMSLGDCDDANPTTFPGARETVGDEVDSDCDGIERCYTDADGDGYGVGDVTLSADSDCDDGPEASAGILREDCDDTTPAVHPGVGEVVANGVDDNCDGIERCFADMDQDGFTGLGLVDSSDLDCSDPQERAVATVPVDCDDFESAVHPNAEEVVGNGVDNDCDGAEVCFVDADFDGFHAPDLTRVGADLTCLGRGELPATEGPTDCNDASAVVFPGALDRPGDGVDQDCDGADSRVPRGCSVVAPPVGLWWTLPVLMLAIRRRRGALA